METSNNNNNQKHYSRCDEKDNSHYTHGIGTCRSLSVYEKLNKIGEGTYGVVYRAKDKESGKIYALKKILMHRERDGLPITALREITLLKITSHPNIVKMHEVVVGKEIDSIYLVFEFVEHDLAGLIDSVRTPFSESEVKCLMIQLLKAVEYLHSHWIIHRGELKLADFGLARLYGKPLRQLTPKVVTLWYRGPELLLGSESYSITLDMWAVGCIFGELLQNRPVFTGKTEIDQLHQIFALLGSPSERIWPGYSKLPYAKKIHINEPYNNLRVKFPHLSNEGHDLLDKMLTYDPAKRITASEALKHQYFKERPLPKDPAMMPTFPVRSDHQSDYKGKRKYEGDVGRHQDAFDKFDKFNGDVFADH